MKRTALFVVLNLILTVSSAGATIALGDVDADRHSAIAVSDELQAELAAARSGEPLLVLVTGATTRDAIAAVRAADLRAVEVFDKLDLVAAIGHRRAILDLHDQPGVLRVDANSRLELLDDVAHRATGIAALRDTATHPQLRRLARPGQSAYDGSGVSIAVVDGAFDPTHEQFVENGKSKFDVHLRQGCPLPPELGHYFLPTHSDTVPGCDHWIPVPRGVRDGNPDHGTMVAATAAGYPRTTPGGAGVSGTAPGARLVALSIGAGGYYYNTVSALNWVLEHHEDPCGDGTCPPIRVVNNSYGYRADDEFASRRFDPDHPMSRVTTELVEAGMVVVYGGGNDGGDGTTNQTSVLALHPLPGVLGVAAYDDGNAGDRDLRVAKFSSRGLKGDPSTYLDIAAPGLDLLTACPPQTFLCEAGSGQWYPQNDGPYQFMSGTSLSGPYVAGVVAQLLEANPSLSPAEIEDILEDTAYQFGPAERYEPDIYQDPDGQTRGNADHLTSFDAGHGLVDVVAALSSALGRGSLSAPAPCLAQDRTSFSDPTGDTTAFGQGSVPRPGHDIVRVTASLDDAPGALTVEISYDDLPDTESMMRTTIKVNLDGRHGEIDLQRSVAGADDFTVFEGPVEVDRSLSSVNTDEDTVRFVLRPTEEPLAHRAGINWAYTSTTTATSGPAEFDLTHQGGACLLVQ